MKQRLPKTCASLILLALAALPAYAALDIIPCAVGNKWQYDCVKLLRADIVFQGKTFASMDRPSSGSAVYEVVSVDSKPNPPVYEYSETTNMQTPVGTADTAKTGLMVTNTGDSLRILSTYSDSDARDKPAKQSYDPPLLYFSAKDATAGKTWQVGVMHDDTMKTPMSARGAERETVTVPAGTFKDCLKVIYFSDDVTGTLELMNKTFTVTSGRTRGIYWIADGVGVVKELEIATSVAESPGPGGKPFVVQAATCTVSELKPGFVVKK